MYLPNRHFQTKDTLPTLADNKLKYIQILFLVPIVGDEIDFL